MNEKYVKDILDLSLDSSWEKLPEEVQNQSKRCLLDNLGCLIAGTQTPVATIMANFVARQYGGEGEKAMILCSGQKSSIVGAALANGFSANALDMDDGHNKAKGHSGSGLLPGIISLVQMESSKHLGKDFLTALAIGSEIALRASMIRHDLYPAYHPSGSWVGIGIAAAAGHLLGMDRDTVAEAMGTAEYHGTVGPMMKCIQKPSMVKDGLGWGAMVGVSSVLMAQEGFTGVKPIFADGAERFSADFPGTWEFLNIYFKPFACCRWAHSAITAAQKVNLEMNAEGYTPENIKEILVKTYASSKALSWAHPKDTEEAQYALPYPVAVTLLDGECGPRQILPPRIFDQQVLALQNKIKVKTSEECEEPYPGVLFSEVIVSTECGREFRSGLTQPKWDPLSSPASDQELESKFRTLVTPVLGESKTENLIRMIKSLEELDNIQDFIEACTL